MSSGIGHVFWIFGLSGAGKSTLATLLAENLRLWKLMPLMLDGDVLRAGLCRGTGFSNIDRMENIRRAAEVAKLGMESGLCVIATFITPLNSHRNLVSSIIGADKISLILADSPLAVCTQRDPKGLYAKAHAGQIRHMTGIDASFEAPAAVDLTVQTSGISQAESSSILLDFCLKKLGLPEASNYVETRVD